MTGSPSSRCDSSTASVEAESARSQSSRPLWIPPRSSTEYGSCTTTAGGAQSVGDRRDRDMQISRTIVVVGEPGPRAAEYTRATLAALAALEQSAETIVDETVNGTKLVDITAQRRDAINSTQTEVVCFLTAGVVPTATWLDGLLAYFGSADVVGVGGPVIPAHSEHLAKAAAAAIYESRLAAGPLARRHAPGNLRETADQSLANIAVRRSAAITSACFHIAAERRDDGDVPRALAQEGRILFAPDAPVIREMPQLARPLLESVHRHGFARGRGLAVHQRAPLSALAPAALATAVLLAPLAPRLPRSGRTALRGCFTGYAVALIYAGGHAALRHRRADVGLAFVVATPAAHLAYGVGVLRGVAGAKATGFRRRLRPRSAD